MIPGVRLVIDIGGQNSKAIAVDDDGLVEEFEMNDSCASGAGRFYEVLARALEVDLDDLGELALSSTEDLEASIMFATCTETEMVSLLAQDKDLAASHTPSTAPLPLARSDWWPKLDAAPRSPSPVGSPATPPPSSPSPSPSTLRCSS